MPSDERIAQALAALTRPLATFRSVLVRGQSRIQGLLNAAPANERAALSLGAFANGHIDPARFATLERGMAFDAAARARLRRSLDILQALLASGDDVHVTDVRPDGPIDLVIQGALANLGCAFGAITTAEFVRTGRYSATQHDLLTVAWGVEHWTKAERRQAPPLVVTVDGADLHAGKLTHLLDGNIHLVLVVRGACSPAPLVRAITPNTFVLQTHDATGLDRFNAYDGPAIAALVPDTAARFVHNPVQGTAPWQRITVWHKPEPPRKSIDGLSAAQQAEELAQLDALAQRPTLGSTPVEQLVPGGSGDPAERLASWLLAQSGFANAS